MTTISLKLPDELAGRLAAEARRRQKTKSELVREAVVEKLARPRGKGVTCGDLAADLAGSVRGSPDLSFNKDRLARALRS